MLPLLDKDNQTYQHFIVNKFGYTDDFVENYFKELKKAKQKTLEVLTKNKDLRCICCGQVFSHGIKGENLLKKQAIFPITFNGAYSFPKFLIKQKENFVCSPCLYSLKNYQKLKMQNFVATKKSLTHIKIAGDKNNEMYEYFLEEKEKEPFIMVINSRGKVLEFLTHLAVASVSTELVTLVFGEKLMYIDTNLLEECLKDTVKLMEKFDIGKNLLINQDDDEKCYKYFIMRKNKKKKDFFKELSDYHFKYDKEIRIITGKLLTKYIHRTKGDKK